MLNTVSHVDIELWISQFPSLYSRQTWLNRINTFFVFAKRRGYVTSNPCERIEPISIDVKPPGIHTVENVEKLLRKCQSEFPDLIGYIAPIYFGGLRPIESEKLLPKHVFEDLIEVTPENCKTRSRRFIVMHATLREWMLIPGAKFGGQFSRTTLRRRLRALKASLAPFPWPHDVLRHSFCSYGLPIFGAAKIAEWAGHSEKILFRHYRERVRMEEAVKFWGLTPEACRTNPTNNL